MFRGTGWTAAILAGGQARRFDGRDKSRLPIGGRTLIDRQLDVLRRVAEHILIVANDPTRYRAVGVPVVPDLLPGTGPLGGIYTAVAAAPTERTLVVACDMPFLRLGFLEHLIASAGDVDVAIPRTEDGYQPLCACYSRGCAAAIRRRLEAGSLAVTDLLADVRVRELGPDEVAAFDPGKILFLNVNTPEDYARALERLSVATD